jgi:hypothetical protein
MRQPSPVNDLTLLLATLVLAIVLIEILLHT